MGWIRLFQRIWTLFSPSCWPLTHSPPLLVGIEPPEDDLCYKTKLWIPLVLFLSSLSQSFKSNLLQVDVALPMQTGEINFPNSEKKSETKSEETNSEDKNLNADRWDQLSIKIFFSWWWDFFCSTLGAHNNPITAYIEYSKPSHSSLRNKFRRKNLKPIWIKKSDTNFNFVWISWWMFQISVKCFGFLGNFVLFPCEYLVFLFLL